MMKIRYVASSMLFWWRETNLSFEQECQFLRSHGFGIELWPTIRGQDECRYEQRNWPRLAAATSGMVVSMRTQQSINGGLGLDRWQLQIECAKMLNANIVTDLRSLGIKPDEKMNGSTLPNDIIKMADQLGVTICLETGPLDVVLKLGDKFKSLRYCLDTGYAHIDTNHSFREYIDVLGDRIIHLHLTDNYGQKDDHLPPGLKGGISKEDWQYLLEALQKYDNEIIGSLEMYPCMPAVMLRQAKEFLFDELNWPNKPQTRLDDTFVAYTPM
jgi:sugar phosphate isomerase/epimerase